MPYKDLEIKKLYYSIGEVAKILEVNPSLIRFWEKYFNLTQPKKNRKGNRLFVIGEIETLKQIHHLVKEQGYTLSGAKEFLSKNPSTALEKLKMIQSLQELKSFLLEVRDKI